MDLELDPQEVLEHLNALGYYNVSKDQLKEFIKDLKKLIKYDTKKGDSSLEVSVRKKSELENSHSFKSEKFVMDSKQYVASNGKHLEGSPSSTVSEYSFPSINNTEENNKENVISRTNKSISCSLQCSKKNCSIHGSVNSKGLPKRPHCIYCQSNCRQPSKESGLSKGVESSVCNCHRCRPVSSSKKDDLPPCGSFIRPSSSSSRQGKSDPVALYHRYQSVWSQQNLPGENPHADLRWKIRHKMMGPNPSKIEERKNKTAPDRPPWVDP